MTLTAHGRVLWGMNRAKCDVKVLPFISLSLSIVSLFLIIRRGPCAQVPARQPQAAV